MFITKETDYALRILWTLADGKQHAAVSLAEDEQIPLQFAYKILRKIEKGGVLRVVRGADGGCPGALVSVTYNLDIYPAMHNFLMDMKALNVQNRTIALIENGS